MSLKSVCSLIQNCLRINDESLNIEYHELFNQLKLQFQKLSLGKNVCTVTPLRLNDKIVKEC